MNNGPYYESFLQLSPQTNINKCNPLQLFSNCSTPILNRTLHHSFISFISYLCFHALSKKKKKSKFFSCTIHVIVLEYYVSWLDLYLGMLFWYFVLFLQCFRIVFVMGNFMHVTFQDSMLLTFKIWQLNNNYPNQIPIQNIKWRHT